MWASSYSSRAARYSAFWRPPPRSDFFTQPLISTTRRSSSSRWAASQSVVTRGSLFSILRLQDVVFPHVFLGQSARFVLVVLAEASFDDLVLQVVFETLDPTSRPQAELLHQVVAIEGALQLLHGVLGPNLVHPATEAAPGLLGDTPPPRGAPRDICPGQPEEHVDVGEFPVAAREVRIPDKAPHGGIAPGVAARGVPVRAHVVGDQVGDGVYVVFRVGEASHRPSRYGRPDVLVTVEVDPLGYGTPPADLTLSLPCALANTLRPAVGAAVLVDERPRLTDVVEESRLAQNGVGLDAGDHDQGVLEDVFVVELGLLLDVDGLHKLGHHVGHEPETHQRPQTGRHVPGEQDLLELLPLALGGDALEPVGVVTDRRFEVGRYRERFLGP